MRPPLHLWMTLCIQRPQLARVCSSRRPTNTTCGVSELEAIVGLLPVEMCFLLPQRTALSVTKPLKPSTKLGRVTGSQNAGCYSRAIHDELFVKLKHVTRGDIPLLLQEIRTALMVDSSDDAAILRVELYSASMAKDAGSDLQSYVSYIKTRVNKLHFLNVKITDAELIHIFLRGLIPAYQQLQVYFACPGALPDGTSFDKVVEIVRKYSASPAMATELAKAKASSPNAAVFAVNA